MAPGRGLCGYCGFMARLTPGGYLATHAVVWRDGKPQALWSIFDRGVLGVAVLCSGRGRRPRKSV